MIVFWSFFMIIIALTLTIKGQYINILAILYIYEEWDSVQDFEEGFLMLQKLDFVAA